MNSPRRSLASFALLAAAAAAIVAGCGARVTSVGSLGPDGGDATLPHDDATAPLDAPTTGDASAEADAACACGAAVCGRLACDGRECGPCAIPEACLSGQCAPHCPGTPCVDDVSGHMICPGDLGAQHCAGGAHFQVCTCDGSGPHGWASCGACL